MRVWRNLILVRVALGFRLQMGSLKLAWQFLWPGFAVLGVDVLPFSHRYAIGIYIIYIYIIYAIVLDA